MTACSRLPSLQPLSGSAGAVGPGTHGTSKEVLEFALAHVSYNPRFAAVAANRGKPIYNPEAWMLIALFKDFEGIPSHPVGHLVQVCKRFREKWNQLQCDRCGEWVAPGRCQITGMFWLGYDLVEASRWCPTCAEEEPCDEEPWDSGEDWDSWED